MAVPHLPQQKLVNIAPVLDLRRFKTVMIEMDWIRDIQSHL